MKKLSLFSLLALTGLGACSTVVAVPENSAHANTSAIKDITIVDVEQGTLIPGQTVLVVNDRIDKIGPQAKVKIPQGATIIDGQGLYLMPGLVDAHVHYFDAPVFGRLMIANGILLVRDTGMPNEYILPLRDKLNRGEMLGPELITTGAILDGDPPIIPSISVGIKTPEEGRAEVRKQAAAGVDMIKTYRPTQGIDRHPGAGPGILAPAVQSTMAAVSSTAPQAARVASSICPFRVAINVQICSLPYRTRANMCCA